MKNKKKSKSVVLLLLLLILGISIGYAALTTTLNINGNTTIEKASWDIHFENLVKTTGSEVATVDASIDDTKTLIEYTVTLPKPGDYYEFTVDIVNNGTIDAMISEVLKEGLTTEQEKYISYTATYSDGVALEEKDYLKSGETQNIRVRVKYRDDISASELPTENQSLSLKFMVTYIQADESAKERTVAICKRATELHTEECNRNSDGCYNAGYYVGGTQNTSTITYGKLGIKGTTPESGDAFDCDVNGDGKYDSETERFYYISDMYDTKTKQFNSNYAGLVYYNNTSVDSSGKVRPDSSSSSYVSYYYGSANENWHGPEIAIKNLPAISVWDNVSLFSTNRTILNEQGGGTTNNGSNLLPTSFSYTKQIDGTQVLLAARLLTYQEVATACMGDGDPTSTGELDICNYLLENTKYANDASSIYGHWLETSYSSGGFTSWILNGSYSSMITSGVSTTGNFGVRPVIEVPKSNILY